MRNEYIVCLLLGSNMGDRLLHMENALRRLSEVVGELQSHSATYETDAWGKTDQPAFLNMAVSLKTRLTPTHLLSSILNIEKEMGRLREVKWGERTIDIDILLYDRLIVNEPDLVIPHPEMHKRRFALAPLADICPDALHPSLGKTIAKLLAECPDTLAVTPFSNQQA